MDEEKETRIHFTKGIDQETIDLALSSKDPALLRLVYKYLTDPLINFQPRPDQPELHDQQTSFVNDRFSGMACVVAGNASGKSFTAAAKVAQFLRDTPPPANWSIFWVLSQNIEMASGVCWQKHLSQFITPDMIHDIKWYSEKTGMPSAVILKTHANGNRHVIEFKSYDQDRKRLQARAITGVWLDELCPYDILIEVWTRCREWNFPGSMIYTLTPLEPAYELEKIYNEQEKHKDWRFYRMNMMCNDAIPLERREQILNNTLEEQRDTRLFGAFASYTGAVYKNFNPAVHVIPEQDFHRPGFLHIRGLDLGWDHPTACVWAAKNCEGKYFIYKEYLQAKVSIEDHVEAINADWGKGPEYLDTWADYAAAQDRHELSIRGLPTRAAFKDVNPGIAKVQTLLREKRLVITSNCENLIKQMRSYSWHPHIANRVIKQDDDLCDALRYLLFSDGRADSLPKPLNLPPRPNRSPI